MNSGKTANIWEGEKIDNPLIDSQNKQLAFELDDKIWLYKQGSPKPVSILTRTHFLKIKNMKS